MTNLLTPLKKLGKKMTGQDISGSNLVTVVDDIANKYTGGGGSGDGGGEGGGGCDCQPTVLHATFDPDTNITSITDMTAGEVFSIIESGNPVVVIIDDEDGTSIYSVFKANLFNNAISVDIDEIKFTASSADEYLTYSFGGGIS